MAANEHAGNFRGSKIQFDRNAGGVHYGLQFEMINRGTPGMVNHSSAVSH